MIAGVLVALSCLLDGCAAPDDAPAVAGLLSRKAVFPLEDEIVVNACGRRMCSLVLLRVGYAGGGEFPLLLAVHNFGGDAAGFARLIHAAKFARAGILVGCRRRLISFRSGRDRAFRSRRSSASPAAGESTMLPASRQRSPCCAIAFASIQRIAT